MLNTQVASHVPPSDWRLRGTTMQCSCIWTARRLGQRWWLEMALLSHKAASSPCAGKATSQGPHRASSQGSRQKVTKLAPPERWRPGQFPSNFSEEGPSALLFLIPSLEPTAQRASLVLFQPDIKKFNDLPPARLCSNAGAECSESTTTTSS